MAKHSGKLEKHARTIPEPIAPVSDTPIDEVKSRVIPPIEVEPTIPRLGVPYNPKTGKIEFSGMRPSTREKIRTLLDDDRLSKELGASSPIASATSADTEALSGMVVTVLYDAIGSLAVILAKSRGFGTHAEILRYTAEEKAQLSAPTIKVLSKYDLLGGKYADELLLLAAVGSITAGHVMAMTHAHAASVGPTVLPMNPSIEKVS